MTNNDIIKALEKVKGHQIVTGNVCVETNTFDYVTVAQLIEIYNQLQAEIERLKKQHRLNLLEQLDIAEQIKAEAVKEFADEFEHGVLHKEFWNNHPHTSQVWLNGYEQCMRDIRVMLKDKVKEMVGDE